MALTPGNEASAQKRSNVLVPFNELMSSSYNGYGYHRALHLQQIGAADHRGLTALHHASSQGLEGVLVALLERGADPEVSPLHHCPLQCLS